MPPIGQWYAYSETVDTMRVIVEATVFAAVCLLTGFAYWLAWNNRASDKVLSAVLPITTVAAIGVISVVLIFGALPEARAQFATVFIAETNNILRSYPRSIDAVSEEVRTMLEHFSPRAHGITAMPEEKLLFHHALQRQIIGALTHTYAKELAKPPR